MKMHELFSRPRSWCQGYVAKSSLRSKIQLSADDPKATCFCLEGALERCYPDGRKRRHVYKRIIKKLSFYQLAWMWNDNPGRTKRQVLKLCKELNI